MAMHSQSSNSTDQVTAGTVSRSGGRNLLVWQVLSALLLLAMGGIHLYLVFHGFDGLVGTLFVLNAIGSLVLAIAIVLARGRLLSVVSVLSLLFMAGTLLSLILALTLASGFLGVHEQLGAQLVSTTLIVESIGTIVLVVTTALAVRAQRTG